MAYQKTPQEQLQIVRQSSLQRAVQLHLAGYVEAGQLERVAENFVKYIYGKIGVPVGGVVTEAQTQGMIILQNVLTRTVEMAVVGGIDAGEVFTAAEPLANYVYEGCDAKS